MGKHAALTAEQWDQIHRLKELGGDVLFETSTDSGSADRYLRTFAGALGQLYGEAIRSCRGRDGLKDEVQTSFMSGMAESPNFEREEVLRDPGGEAREDKKSPGQLLYEEHVRGCEGYEGVTWDMLCMRDCERYEERAAEMAAIIEQLAAHAKAKQSAVMEKILDAPVGAPLPEDSPFGTIDWEAKDEPCPKCHGSGNMSQLGGWNRKCDECQ